MIFQLPVYVQQIKSGYLARPLFFPAPARTDADLHRLITKLNRDVVQHLEKLGKANRQDELANWAFSPSLSTARIKIEIELRRRRVKAAYLLVMFRHLGKRLAFSPSLPELWFEYERSENVEHRAKAVFEEYWRKVEREADETEEVKPEGPALAGQAWVQLNPISVQVPVMRPKVEQSLFMFLGGGTGVADGASELRRVGRCLDWLYPNELERAHQREADVQELMKLLDDPENRPLLLVGPRQVGKTTLIQECVFRRAQLREGKQSNKRQVWLLSPQRLISGMSYVGQWESRLLGILKYAKKRELVLYFDDLIGLFLAGRSANSSLNVAQVMKPYLEDRAVRVLGEITPEGLRVLREQDRSFADQFQVIPVRESNDADNLKVLLSVQRQLESKLRCNFDLDVLPTVIELQRRYERTASFPGKGASVLTRLAVRHGIKPDDDEELKERQASDPLAGRAEIRRADVFTEFTGRTGLSLEFLDPLLRLDRDKVFEQLQSQVVGQSPAIEALADVVSVAKARLNDPERPLAAFLFLGPTGVGKTESAKALARTLFGHEDRLLRFDLNEFNQPGSAARLVGTLGQPEGLLTSAIRRQPFAVILLDEIEKADPDVFDVLLQVLGEGRLTDALGRTADFTNAIIILTSNLGVRESEGGVGFVGNADQSGSFTRAAERFFRPEFFNRLDRVIPFKKLTRDEMGRIAQRLVDLVLQREGFAQRQCVLSVSPAALELVIQAGYDPVLGARAMKRAVENQVAKPAATRLAALEQNALTIVTIGASDSGLTVSVQAPRMAERLSRTITGTAVERVEAYRTKLDEFDELLEGLRPKGGISGKVTPEQERYYSLKERADLIAEKLDKVEEYQEQSRLSRLGAGSPQAMGRRARYKSIAKACGWNRDFQPDLNSLKSVDNMEQAIDEVLQDLQPIDEDQELYEIDRQLAFLKLMTTCEADDKPVYVWVRGYPEGPLCGHAHILTKDLHQALKQDVGLESTMLSPNLTPQSDRVVELKGQHARALAKLEEGTHLFLPKHGGPVPIRVTVLDHLPTEADRSDDYGTVLRLYPDQKPVIDLRSGLVGPRPLTAEMMRAFMLAAIE